MIKKINNNDMLNSRNFKIEEYQEAREILFRLNASIRSLVPTDRSRIDFTRAGYSEVKESSINGQMIERVIIILRGTGCGWARDKNGGCTMCGHISGSSRGKTIPVEHLKKQFDDAFNAYDFRKYPMLCLYNGGSLLNEDEIPLELRYYIYQRVNANPHIKRFVIESRPEYVTDAALDEIDEMLADTEIEIGIGLESSNDLIRELILNKGVALNEFRTTATRLRERKVKFVAYVLVKPPFITEAEAIVDAVSTIEFAHSIGVDIIFLEPVSIQDYTLVNYLWEAGSYRAPWIWSIFEIIKETIHFGMTLRIGGFDFYPIPKHFTSNCPICNPEMLQRIKAFNRSNDLNILNDVSCQGNCRIQWEKELNTRNEKNIIERIRESITLSPVHLDNLHPLHLNPVFSCVN